MRSRSDAARLATRIGDVRREKIGAGQLRRLAREFARNAAESTNWNLLGNPTLMAPVRTPDVAPYLGEADRRAIGDTWPDGAGFLTASRFGLPLSLDAWDGYAAERARLLAALARSGAGPTLVLTGDTHAWWVNDLPGQGGVELAVSSVTAQSPFSDALLAGRGRRFELLLNRENPNVRYVSGQTHGFLDLTLTRSRASAVFRAVSTVRNPAYRMSTQAAFRITRAGNRLTVRPVSALWLPQAVLFGPSPAVTLLAESG